MPSYRVYRRVLCWFAVLLVAVVGCGSPSHPAPWVVAHKSGVVVIKIGWRGGFAGVGRPDLPLLALYGDGMLITPAPGSGPLLLARQSSVDERTVMKVYQDADSAGMDTPYDDRNQVQIPDGAVLTITVNGVVSRFVQPSASDPGRRGMAARFVEAQQALANATGAPYQPERFAVVATAIEPAGRPVTPWPLGALGTGIAVDNGICVTLPADQVEPVAATANQSTLWSSGGRTYRVYFRPLLPDELDCTAIR